jgi:hypothetical protein
VTVTVVYESETRHVLGVLSVTGGGAPPDAAPLVGPGLPARVVTRDRSAVVDATVPAERLRTAVVEDTPGLLADPYAFAVEIVNGEARSRLLSLAPWREGSGVTVDSHGVHVVLGRGVPEGTRMLVVLATEDGPAGMWPGHLPTDGSVDLEATLAPGGYGVLTLVSGYAGRVDPGTVE